MMKKLIDLFEVKYGHSLELNRLRLSTRTDGIPFVSRKMGDNGIAAYVERISDLRPNPAGELTCALSGNGVLSTFIQDRPYYTAFHVACLRPRIKLTPQELLYYSTCIRANRYRYSWGRQANRTVKDILLPAPSDIPAWVNEANVRQFEGRDRPAESGTIPALEILNWKWVSLSALFELKKGKRLTKAKMIPGRIPFIGATDSNNGVTYFVGQSERHSGNTISVTYNGSVAEAFYQPIPYWASDDVNVLYPKFRLSPAIAMFLITLIRKEKYRFNYGRKWHLERMAASKIKIPMDDKGVPDWIYMERFVKRLPYSAELTKPFSLPN